MQPESDALPSAARTTEGDRLACSLVDILPSNSRTLNPWLIRSSAGAAALVSDRCVAAAVQGERMIINPDQEPLHRAEARRVLPETARRGAWAC
jgi:hypothetical protein